MRRHGLRDRIRHQRRLTRRLVARHVLIRRPNSVARTLEALGAWTVEPLMPPTRFVPAVAVPEEESVMAAADYLPTASAAGVPEPADDRWEDGLTQGAGTDAELAPPNATSPRSPVTEPAEHESHAAGLARASTATE